MSSQSPGRFTGPWAPKAQRMNRKRVIILMTIAVAFMLAVPMTAIFDGVPPWPVLFWFVASHVFFCIVIIRVKPFNGPYVEPLGDRDPGL